MKSFIVDSTHNNMRVDRFLRNKLGKVPQSLIEKGLRSGKIKVNKKKLKVRLRFKLKTKLICLILSSKKKFYKKRYYSIHQMK